jgi:5-methylcytosine-specific restriction endonuclease McrA
MTINRISNWQDALVAQILGKVDVLEIYEEQVCSEKLTFNIPAVVRLRSTEGLKHSKRSTKFSRVNLFTRDAFTCQYCGTKKGFKQLNYDHVVPRVQGGKTTWDNIVTACFSCNSKKDGRTPEQAKMPLLRKPVKPESLPHVAPILTSLKVIPEEWQFYLSTNSIVLGCTG